MQPQDLFAILMQADEPSWLSLFQQARREGCIVTGTEICDYGSSCPVVLWQGR